MKYIYLLIFFLSAFSSNNALAFWNNLSNAQKQDCLDKAEGFGSTTFTSKKRYQACIRETKEKNKQKKNTERLVKKYYDDCFPDLFEDFKSDAHQIIYAENKNYITKRGKISGKYMTVGKDSEDRIQLFLREINLNPEDNQYFKFTDDQSLLLFNVSKRVSSDPYALLPEPNLHHSFNRSRLYDLRDDFMNKLGNCAEDKSKPFFKF